ncbi:MAG: hypothetical protein Q8R37_03295 [Nanoarchaeota archaeon]|nr:hypothetical protein [Nanoarchaeota archaeon]
MKPAFKKLLLNWRVMLLLLFLLFSVIAIKPQIFGHDGVIIRHVSQNSSAADAGLENPSPTTMSSAREKILSLNRQEITSLQDYYSVVSAVEGNTTLRVETDRNTYTLLTTADSQGVVDLGLKVSDIPFTNLRKGLDLEGGIRVLLKPATEITADELEITIASLTERLNVFGLSDIVVRSASDLSGGKFILIEIAGVNEEEVKNLLARQGKFEAKIGNNTVFFGGKEDITYVCRSAECSGIDPQRGCGRLADGSYACSFFFSITLSPEAAQRQAKATEKLTIVEGSYLSEDLTLFLDDAEVDRLRIVSSLKGQAATSVQITGSGAGRTEAEAVTNSLSEMKRLQTIIITGSLPVKLDIVKFDTISPSLGKEFLNNIFIVGILALAAVIVVIFVRYRQLKVILPMVFCLLSELIMLLGFAAFVGWNLDLAAIAGIIISIGTGVDHFIIITDETVKGAAETDWKKRIKNAMFVVMGAYLTTIAGMLPLLWAGAGLLKGFALTTIAGVTFGVFVARPAYAVIIEHLLNHEE